MFRPVLLTVIITLSGAPAQADEPARLSILWPPNGAVLPLSDAPDQPIGVVVNSNFVLKPAESCGGDLRCGHVHLRIDPEGTSCNISPTSPITA